MHPQFGGTEKRLNKNPGKGNAMKAFVFTLLLCTIFIAPSLAQTSSPVDNLISRMPEDVLGYYAFSGLETAKPQFDKSSIGGIWNTLSFQIFYNAIKTQIIAKIESEDPNNSVEVKQVFSFASELANFPLVIGVSPSRNSDFPVSPFAIVDVSAEKTRVNEALLKLHKLDKEGDIIEVEIANIKLYTTKDDGEEKLYWGWVDNYFVFAINNPRGLTVKALSAKPKDTTKYIRTENAKNDILTAYIDVTKILDTVKSAFPPEEAEDIKKVEAVLDILGFADITHIKSSCGFNGPDVQSTDLLAFSGQRKGILAAMKKIDMKSFDAVDARAAAASVVNIDFSAIYDVVMQTIKAVAPSAGYDKIQQAIKDFESESGMNIRSGLLESLAGPQTFYVFTAGSVPEAPAGGAAVVVKLKDKTAFENSMNALEKLISAQKNQMLQITSQVYKGRTVHFYTAMPLAMMQMVPSWTIVDDQLLITSNQGLLDVAINQLTSQNPAQTSIRSIEAFKKETQNIPGNLLSFTYKDSQKQATQFMVSAQQFWPLMSMGLAKQGIFLPTMLPQIQDAISKINPSVSYTWHAADGIHTSYKGSGLEMSTGAIAVGVGVAILMPALAKAKKTAQKVVSASNLKGIGTACVVYAFDYNDNFPPDLEALIKEADLSPKTLQSTRKPKNFDGPSFIYIPGQSGRNNPANVLAYENPAFLKDGTNVLYVDGHVEFVKPERFKKALQETYNRLNEEMPKTKFRNKCAP
ncbi:MAG: hypothetical protein FVQ79_01505 [Planctomycetes bacterium]|nr:hypothetical protein [Planctomycetota bacterium]